MESQVDEFRIDLLKFKRKENLRNQTNRRKRLMFFIFLSFIVLCFFSLSISLYLNSNSILPPIEKDVEETKNNNNKIYSDFSPKSIQKINQMIYPSTTDIFKNLHEFNFLYQKLGNSSMIQIYKGSVNGFDDNILHRMTKNEKNLLFIAKTNTNGSYTRFGWFTLSGLERKNLKKEKAFKLKKSLVTDFYFNLEIQQIIQVDDVKTAYLDKTINNFLRKSGINVTEKRGDFVLYPNTNMRDVKEIEIYKVLL